MKTLFLFEEVPEKSFFFELEGDYSDLNGIYINSGDDRKLCDKLCALVYHPDTGKLLVKPLDIPTKDWDVFVKCGFIL